MLCSKDVLEPRIQGTVKWYNVKNGYGFITRDDTGHDIFVHRTSIVSRSEIRSVGDGEHVQFDVAMGERGLEAINVTGANGGAVKGSPFAAKRMRLRLHMRQRENKSNVVVQTTSNGSNTALQMSDRSSSVSLNLGNWKTYHISTGSETMSEHWYGTRTFCRRIYTPSGGETPDKIIRSSSFTDIGISADPKLNYSAVNYFFFRSSEISSQLFDGRFAKKKN